MLHKVTHGAGTFQPIPVLISCTGMHAAYSVKLCALTMCIIAQERNRHIAHFISIGNHMDSSAIWASDMIYWL